MQTSAPERMTLILIPEFGLSRACFSALSGGTSCLTDVSHMSSSFYKQAWLVYAKWYSLSLSCHFLARKSNMETSGLDDTMSQS